MSKRLVSSLISQYVNVHSGSLLSSEPLLLLYSTNLQSISYDRFFHGCVFFMLLFNFCFGTIDTLGTFPPDLYRSVLESTSVQSRSILESTSIDKLSLGSFLTRLSISTQTFYRLFSDVLPVQNFSSAIFYICVFMLCSFFLFAFIHRHAQKSGNTLITDITA